MNNILAKIKNFKNASEPVKASIAYTLCGIVQQGISILTLPIFTRILTAEQYGITTVYTATASMIGIFLSLQLPYGTLQTAMIKFEDDRDGYISSALGLCTTLTAIYLLICVIFHGWIESTLKISYFLQLLLGIELLMNNSQAFWMGKQRFEFKYKSVVYVTLADLIASIGLSFVAIYLFPSFSGTARVAANAGITIVIGAYLYFLAVLRGKKLFNKRYWRYALTFNVPLIPYYLSQSVFNQSDRLMISSMCGTGQAAIYSVAYSLGCILVFVINAINNSYTPWMFNNIKHKTFDKCAGIALGLSALVASLLLCIIMFTPEAVRIMAPAEYYSAIYVVPPIVLSTLLLYYTQFFGGFEFYFEKKQYLLISSFSGAIINIVLNFLLIPIFGFTAAAYTTLFSYMTFAGLECYFMKKICRENGLPENIYDIKGMIFVFLLLAAAGFVFMFLYSYILIRYAVIALLAVLVFIFRNKLISLVKGYFDQMKVREEE